MLLFCCAAHLWFDFLSFFLFRWLCWLLACWNGYTHSQRVPGKKVKNHVYVWLNAQCVIYSQRVCACTFRILCTGPVERTTSGCLACGVGWSGVPNSIHVLSLFCWMSVHVSVTIICTGSAPWEGCLPVPVLHLLSVWLLIPSFLFFSFSFLYGHQSNIVEGKKPSLYCSVLPLLFTILVFLIKL